MYAEGDPELIAFSSLLDADSTEDLTRRDGVRDVVIGQEAREYDELKAAEVLLEVREDQVADARDDVAVKREAAAEHLVLMQSLEAEEQAAKDSVVALVIERRDARAAAPARHAPRTLAKLRKLEKEQQQIEEMLRKRAAGRPASPARAGACQRPVAGPATPSPGLLAYPVDGYVTSPFGYRTHPIYHYWGLHDGVDFGGGCGTPLRAAAPGKVVSSYCSGVYGNRLIIDHGVLAGVGIATIYNHASGYNVGVGDHVQRGPGHRLRGQHRVVHRVPPALHRDGQRPGGRPDELALDGLDTLWDNGPMAKEQGQKMVAQNKKARHDYHIEDTWEAGLVLMGTEVKSLRQGRASLVDGFAEIDNGEAWLLGVHIPEYTQGTWTNHSARRRRKLLLNRSEIDKIERKITDKGYTIVPLALYFKDGRAKVEIALAKGKKSYDKRHTLAERTANREKVDAVQRRLKGHRD